MKIVQFLNKIISNHKSNNCQHQWKLKASWFDSINNKVIYAYECEKCHAIKRKGWDK